ncbi:MAG: hypothetical protein JRH16_22250 [Deltaproteobacteria bacterium]|nr:hypothetical protein [Deltaproteobacteria bacterium]
MTLWEPMLGSALGALAALLHLAATRSRAAIAVRGGVALALVTLPLSVAGPALCLLVAIALSPASAWASLLGFWLLRTCTLAWVGRS